MRDYSFRGAAIHGVTAAAAVLMIRSALAADSRMLPDVPFVDTRTIGRHAGQDLPTPMFLPAFAPAPALFPARGVWPADEHAPLRAAVKDRDVALTGGYEGNGAVVTEAAVLHQALGPAEVWAAARHDRILPCEDGAGQRVNYGYDRLDTQAALGYRPMASTPRGSIGGSARAAGAGTERVPDGHIGVLSMGRSLLAVLMVLLLCGAAAADPVVLDA